MTTTVTVTHKGGNHAVDVSLVGIDAKPRQVARLNKEGDSVTNYVYTSQSILVTEADDAPA